jgi:hypothetical protein
MEHPPAYELPPVITALAYTPDSSVLAISGYHEILLFKADGSERVARLVGLSERIQSLAFSPDGKLLAMAGGSPCRFGEIQIWDVDNKKLKLSQTSTFDTLYGVSWSHDGTKVAFGCADNTLRALEVSSGKQVLYQGAHSDWVLGTTFSRESEYVASVSRDRSMKLTEVATQRFIDNVTSITPGALKGGLLTVARRPLKEKTMAKVPNDTPGAQAKVYDELLIGGADGIPRLYKMHRETKRVIGDDANRVREFPALPGRIYSAAFNADGSLFVVGRGEGCEELTDRTCSRERLMLRRGSPIVSSPIQDPDHEPHPFGDARRPDPSRRVAGLFAGTRAGEAALRCKTGPHRGAPAGHYAKASVRVCAACRLGSARERRAPGRNPHGTVRSAGRAGQGIAHWACPPTRRWQRGAEDSRGATEHYCSRPG